MHVTRRWIPGRQGLPLSFWLLAYICHILKGAVCSSMATGESDRELFWLWIRYSCWDRHREWAHWQRNNGMSRRNFMVILGEALSNGNSEERSTDNNEKRKDTPVHNMYLELFYKL